jgi:hypothetical protein
VSDTPLDGESITRYLHEVAERLTPAGPQHLVIVVGGSLLAWHGLRDRTKDVDTVRRVEPELRAAAEAVALDHDLPLDWLNDRAAGWAPSTFKAEDCDVLLDHPRLKALGMPLGQVFLMKLNALRDADQEDLTRLWPLTGFASAQEAVEQFWLAYPLEANDPYLVEEIERIAARARREQTAPPGVRPPETR